MKALTLHQPWASLVAAGVKSIETRSWSTKYRGPLAIHAAARRVLDGEEVGEWWWTWDFDHGIIVRQPTEANKTWREFPAPLGAVVATCELVDVVPTESIDWFADKWGPNSERFGWRQVQVIRAPAPICSFVCESERPYGDFTPGRFAWLLGDIKEVDVPVPARGRQGLWEWAS